MNIYTASKFENHKQVRWFNQEVRRQGHTVTWDWSTTDEFVGDKLASDNPLNEEDRYRYGMLDYAGVMSCDLCVVLDGPWHLNGARWEAGMALGNGANVWIANYTHKVIFDTHPRVQIFDAPEAVLRRLRPADTFASIVARTVT